MFGTMTKFGSLKAPLVAVAILFLALPAVAAQAQDKMVTSEGIVVATPNIDELDCAQMANVLRGLDESGYRGYETPDEGHPDHKIYIYEDQLSQQQYFNCNSNGGFGDSGAAFSTGFDN